MFIVFGGVSDRTVVVSASVRLCVKRTELMAWIVISLGDKRKSALNTHFFNWHWIIFSG